MPRPKKCRRICAMPESEGFQPISREKFSEKNVLTIDEYETIRLIDYEGCSQEQCALKMDVARTTVTSIYESARFKIADAVINGKILVISGGNVKLCEYSGKCCNKMCEVINRRNNL